MTKDQTEQQRETSVIKAERIAVRLGLQFERMDVWLAGAIAGGLLAVAYLGLTTG